MTQEQEKDLSRSDHPSRTDALTHATIKVPGSMRWIVVIGAGVWAKCYGPFQSYDDVMGWVRINQFNPEDAHPHPVTAARSDWDTE